MEADPDIGREARNHVDEIILVNGDSPVMGMLERFDPTTPLYSLRMKSFRGCNSSKQVDPFWDLQNH